MPVNYTYNNITKNEDMIHYKGIDLNDGQTLFSTDENSPAERAINDVELWLMDYINLNYDFKGTRDNLSDFQKERFKRAVCEQIDYILDNGDLRNLSGINKDTGVVIDINVLEKRGLAPNAFQVLRLCGLANIPRY